MNTKPKKIINAMHALMFNLKTLLGCLKDVYLGVKKILPLIISNKFPRKQEMK